jgi:hypothetical protein
MADSVLQSINAPPTTLGDVRHRQDRVVVFLNDSQHAAAPGTLFIGERLGHLLPWVVL